MKVVILLVIGVWIGMLIGISFVEAPLKFQAPNITLTLGLGIGKLVFAALNKFEILFSIILLVWLIYQNQLLSNWTLFVLALPIVIVVLQSIWLLPVLNLRVEKLLAGATLPKSYDHFYYVLMEVFKVVFLVVGFIKIYSHE